MLPNLRCMYMYMFVHMHTTLVYVAPKDKLFILCVVVVVGIRKFSKFKAKDSRCKGIPVDAGPFY